MKTHMRRQFRKTTDGFIVVTVLWIIAALATLASIYTVYIVNTTRAIAQNDDRIKAEAAISAGLALTASELSVPEKDAAPTHGLFAFRLGRARIAVSFVSEQSRIDLNAAPKPLLAGLFVALGATPEQAANYADRIDEWRMPPRTETKNAGEDKAYSYRAAGLAYGPRRAPFASISELWLVHDLPSQLIERAMAYVTVFSGTASIDALNASPTVLAALPGMTPDRLAAILSQRRADPANETALKQLLGPLQTESTKTAETGATRVKIDVRFDNGRQVKAEAVIRPAADNAKIPYHVLLWRDDLDGAMHDDTSEMTRL